MKILVLNNMAPFIRGGAEELADHLVANLNRAPGVEAELVRVPFRWDPAEQLIEQMTLCRLLAAQDADRVVALKFPAYLVPHAEKTIWLLHQYRQAYDLWDSGHSNIPDTARGREIKRLIAASDDACFAGARKIYCNSAVTRDRLRKYNGFAADVLMPPLNDPERFANTGYGDYLFAGGRVNAGKRQHRLVEAMAQVRSDVRLVIGGPPDSAEDRSRLERLVRKHGLEKRVTLDLGFLPRDRLAAYVNGALACAYLPLDEDSVGYVTMEAFQASKAVLTTRDSGGLLQIVQHGRTGLVCADDPRELAAAVDSLAEDRANTVAMGEAARDLWADLKVTWPDTVKALLQ